MDLEQILELTINILSLVLISSPVLQVYLFFSDPIRRWRFFGYLPTVIVALADPLKKIIIPHVDS